MNFVKGFPSVNTTTVKFCI